MKAPGKKELALIAPALLIIIGVFFLALRHRLGPLYETILIDASGLLQQRPWMDFSGKELRSGFFPLWNPYTGFGQPHLANLQTAVFYPLNLIPYTLGPKFGFELWMLLRLWLGGFFIYLFLRKLKLEIIPSLAGSLVWPLSGYGLWFMQLVELNSQILLPVFLILFHNLSKKARRREFLLIVLVGGLIFFGGHPEAVFNTWLLCWLYFIFRLVQENISGKEKIERLTIAGSASILAAVFAAMVLLPFFNYVPRCWSLHYSGFGFYHLDVKTIFSLLLPGHQFGGRGPGKILVELLNGGTSGVFRAGYAQTTAPGVMPGLGIIGIALVLIGLLKIRKALPEFCFFTAVLIFLLGLTYGIAPFRWLSFLPPFASASNYKFYFSEIYFCLAVLAGLGLSRVSKKTRLFSALIFLALVLSLFLQSRSVKPYLNLGLKNLDGQKWLLAIENDKDSRLYRMAAVGATPALPPNLAMMYGLGDIGSSDALYPRAYVELMEKLNDIEDKDLLSYFYPQYYFRLTEQSLNKHGPSIARAFVGIKWVAGKDLSAKMPWEEYYTIEKMDGMDLAVSKLTAIFPKPYFSRNINGKDEKDGSPGFYPTPQKMVSNQNQKIEIETETDAPGILALTDLYYPGWEAHVDGAEQAFRTDFKAFRFVEIRPGRHQVAFKFAPKDFRIGLWVSLSSLIMMAVVFAMRKRDVKTA